MRHRSVSNIREAREEASSLSGFYVFYPLAAPSLTKAREGLVKLSKVGPREEWIGRVLVVVVGGRGGLKELQRRWGKIWRDELTEFVSF